MDTHILSCELDWTRSSRLKKSSYFLVGGNRQAQECLDYFSAVADCINQSYSSLIWQEGIFTESES